MGVAHITRRGGGNPLNFKVVGGTSAPSSPKENTIWVNTNTEISSWDFSATQPRVRSNNKNLICYPFIHASRTASGITLTDLGDGSIAIEGTATANVYHHLCNIDLGNKYFNSNSAPSGYVISGLVSGVTLEYKSDSDGLLHLTILKGTTVSATVRPQIEKGSAATSFVKGDATGQVWITIGNSSGVAFNALKKNRIQLYPISAKQYVAGAWTDVTAKSYQGGQWVDWYNGEIFSNGNQYTDITGGWKACNGSGQTVTIGSSSIVFTKTGTSERHATAYTVNSLDLSKYTKIIATISIPSTGDEDDGFTLGVTSQNTYNEPTSFVASKTIKAESGNMDVTLDISTVTSGYVALYVSRYATVTVTKVRLA